MGRSIWDLINKEGGDEQEFGLAVEVDLVLAVEIVQVVAGDGGDGDVVDVDLLLPDEEEEEVQRALEDLEPDLVAVGGGRFGNTCVGHRVGHGTCALEKNQSEDEDL
jgi:hypothetical protein